jgi:murein DD-endopeptidase MepM/ murein hydrolase activator NlpD
LISVVWADDIPVTQPWGITDVQSEPPFQLPGGTVHWHCGIDIGLYFVPLNAARPGKVIYESYGLLCVQVGGELDWYVHIDRADVAVGADVIQGQHIAVSGNKVPAGGSLTGPHLHFETRSGPLWLSSGLNINIPTGNDPVPVLGGTHGGGGGTIGGTDMVIFHDPVTNIPYLISAGPGSPVTGGLYKSELNLSTLQALQKCGVIMQDVNHDVILTIPDFPAPSGGSEPVEPKNITLSILSVPGTATGTIS